MSRRARLTFENAVYHVIARGIRKDTIFNCDEDRLTFLKKADEAFEKFGVTCYCYCLMDSHYHMVLKTPSANISKAVHHLNCSYSNWFRAKYRLVGPLFQGRFKGLLVDEDNYLLQLTAYIHLNPVRAGIVGTPELYRWSSFQDYLGKIHTLQTLDTGSLLNSLHRIRRQALKQYLEFINNDAGLEDPLKKPFKGIAVGSEEFTKRIADMLKQVKECREIPETRKRRDWDFEDILGAIISATGKSREEIIRKTHRNQERKLLIYLMKQHTDLNLREIGEIFKIDYTTVSFSAKRTALELKESKSMERLCRKVLKAIEKTNVK
ncbi:MAG: transposase [Candidatus Wallbacteria bacterium]|nr:transposase [Candidatus Wallbacteria bacterium]